MDFGDVIKAWKENPERAFRRRDMYGAMTNGRIHGPGEIIRKDVRWTHEDGSPARESIFVLDEKYGRWQVYEMCNDDILADDWEEVPQEVVDGIVKAGGERYDKDLKGFLADMNRQKEE